MCVGAQVKGQFSGVHSLLPPCGVLGIELRLLGLAANACILNHLGQPFMSILTELCMCIECISGP